MEFVKLVNTVLSFR